MSNAVWEFAHEVECGVPREFAWSYWSNIANWDDPPAHFELTGKFEEGARLKTILPGQTLYSTICDVQVGHAATLALELPGAVLSFCWTFDDAANSRTKLRQRIWLSGNNAHTLAGEAKILEKNVPEAMKKIAAAMEKSFTNFPE